MSERDEYGRYVPDDGERAESIRARRSRIWCKCGEPDLPGTCPGWRNCPMCEDDDDA